MEREHPRIVTAAKMRGEGSRKWRAARDRIRNALPCQVIHLHTYYASSCTRLNILTRNITLPDLIHFLITVKSIKMPKRRAQSPPPTSPSPPPSNRRQSPSSYASRSPSQDLTTTSEAQMTKNLVRLALAAEYARLPLRRSDITAKALGGSSGRSFKNVFAAAQTILRKKFGMTLLPLPAKEKVTVAQKRAAQRSGGSQGVGPPQAYILTSVLPAELRTPRILTPGKAPGISHEAGYTGFYSFVIGVIYLCQGQRCSESFLETCLRRVNADNFLLGDKTDKILKRMEREGYIVKIREREAGGEETVEWVVGPRGRVEVGEEGVAGLVRGVFGKEAGLESRLERSLGSGTFKKESEDIDTAREGRPEEEEVDREEQELGVQPQRRRSGRRRVQQEDEGEEEEEEEEARDGEEGDEVDGEDEGEEDEEEEEAE